MLVDIRCSPTFRISHMTFVSSIDAFANGKSWSSLRPEFSNTTCNAKRQMFIQGRQRETTLANTWYKRLWVYSHTILRCRHAITAPHLEYQPKTCQQQPFYGPLSGTTPVSRYQKKYSPTHHPDHHPVFISFFHLPRSIASSLFKLRAWQSFCTTSVHVLFGLPLGQEPSTSYSIHFFTQSVSSFRNTCPHHRNLFCCSIKIISSIPSLSLNSLLGTYLIR